jgi:hypothetical protein
VLINLGEEEDKRFQLFSDKRKGIWATTCKDLTPFQNVVETYRLWFLDDVGNHSAMVWDMKRSSEERTVGGVYRRRVGQITHSFFS